jgi:hypothetical protein
MSSLIFDIEKLYQHTFGSRPYKVPEQSVHNNPEQPFKIEGVKNDEIYAPDGSLLQTSYLGVEIWLPTRLRGLPTDLFQDGILFMPYTVIRVAGSSTIIRTPLAERRGTIKELYNVEDYKISLKGFFIDSNRVFPYDELSALKKLHEMGTAFFIDNAVSNIFLNSDDRVVITGFDLPEVEGGRKHIKPFSIQLESDTVFTLEWNG